MEQWYKVISYMAHQGAGAYRDNTNYIYADNASEVLGRYKRMPGFKRRRIPSIEPLNPEEAAELEQRIVESGVSIKRAKSTWFFGTRRT